MEIWWMMLGAGALTYLLRLSFIFLLGRLNIPPWLPRALRFVPSAVLSAIIFPELLLADGKLALSLSNARLLAGGLAVLVAWRTRNVIWTIIAGMAILLLLQQWMP
jgi:branched-subunit amino acid transport protein